MKKLLLFVSLFSLSANAGSDFSWTVEKKIENSNQFAWDRRSPKVFEAVVPKMKIQKNAASTLAALVRMDVMLPEPKRVIDQRYVIFTGGRPHDASTHALVWLDSKDNVGAFAINECVGSFSEKQCITVGSKSFTADNLPEAFISELKEWRKKEQAFLVLQYIDPTSKFSKFELAK